MPLYYATLVLRLDEENEDAAQLAAESVAQEICNQSFTDCCTVEGIEREESERELARGERPGGR